MTTEYENPAAVLGKRVYTVLEAAELLEVSTNTVYKLVKEKHFSTRTIGRGIRISKTSFDLWLDEHT